MPYILPERRPELTCDTPGTPGELNYVITRLLLDYLDYRTITGYAAYNEVMGVLESCKLEFYRRMVAPYEDAACERNGDVYTVPDRVVYKQSGRLPALEAMQALPDDDRV